MPLWQPFPSPRPYSTFLTLDFDQFFALCFLCQTFLPSIFSSLSFVYFLPSFAPCFLSLHSLSFFSSLLYGFIFQLLHFVFCPSTLLPSFFLFLSSICSLPSVFAFCLLCFLLSPFPLPFPFVHIPPSFSFQILSSLAFPFSLSSSRFLSFLCLLPSFTHWLLCLRLPPFLHSLFSHSYASHLSVGFTSSAILCRKIYVYWKCHQKFWRTYFLEEI